MSLRVLVVHNRYQQRGGEDSVVEAEVKLLTDAGHSVHLELVSNDSITGMSDKIAAFIHTPFDPSRVTWARDLVSRHRSDVVHVHNFFPLLTPAIHEGAAQAGAAVVQTLHNFRLTCANALLLRDGLVCEKCLGGSKLWGIYHRCYRGSIAGSAALVRMQMRAERHQTWSRYVHRFIALTEFSRGKFVVAGLPEERIATKPNFLHADVANGAIPRSGGLFVGRISEEKGVDVLIEAWRSLSDIPLTVVGDGPARPELERLAPANVRFLGQRSASEVQAEMTRAAFLLVPSVWYEGFPMTVVEAFARHLPVLASNIGSLAEIVRPGVNGDLFEVKQPATIVTAVRRFSAAADGGESLGAGARASYDRSYTPAINLGQLEDIYRQAIAEAARGRQADLTPG